MFTLPTLSVGDVALSVGPVPDRDGLDQVLASIRGIRSVEHVAVDRFSPGESHLTVRLDRPTAFAGELRSALRHRLASCVVHDGRLVAALTPADEWPRVPRPVAPEAAGATGAGPAQASTRTAGPRWARWGGGGAPDAAGDAPWVDGWDRTARVQSVPGSGAPEAKPPFADLVEREAAARALDELEDVSVLTFDRELRFTSRAGALYAPLGRSFDMIRGRQASEVVRPATWALVQEGYEGAIAGRTSSIDFPGLDGEAIHESTFTPLMDGTTLIGGTVVTRDVTAARRDTRLLDELNAVLRVTFDASPIGHALVTTNGRWARVNPVLQGLLGRDEPLLAGGRVQDVTHPDDVAAEAALIAELHAGHRDHFVLSKRFLHADGRDVPVIVTTTLLRGADGAPHGMVCQITERVD